MEYRTIEVTIPEFLAERLTAENASDIVELALMNLFAYHDAKSKN